MNTPTKEPECCPPFDPVLWDGQVFTWNEKNFIKGSVCTFLYMPLNFGKVMRKMNHAVEKAMANIPEWLNLSDHTSSWNMDLYLAVDKEVDGIENVTISGNFLSKVYEGSFKETGKWAKDFASYAKNKGHEVKKMYMWYTTCPKCAKKYGKNYVVIFGQI